MTQLINTMNKVILHKYRLLAIGLVLTCLSCSKEQLSPDSQIATGNPVEMRLTVDAPMFSSVSNNETEINRLRVVVFSSTTAPDAGKLILNKFYANLPVGTNSFKELITSGKRDIYIIVNEPLSGGGAQLDSYKNIASVGDIRKLSLIYDGAGAADVYIPREIPMFVRHLDKQISEGSLNEISGTVERVMAKVSVKLNVKNSNFTSGKYVVVDNITIKNLPESSSWIATDYVGAALVTSEKQSKQVATAESGYDASSNNTFYVPEYILANLDNGAYIEIKGHTNGEPSRISTWKVKLGDAMDDLGSYGDKYNITRNRHYTFTGDVKSYGEMDLEVKVTVSPWSTVNMDEEVGRFVRFSNVTNAASVVIADGSNLNDMGETIKVSCNTNIGGWYVVVRNAKGDVIHTSVPTAAVTSSTEQTADVVIPKLGSDLSQNYTIGIYHPIVANESGRPVKSLSFTQQSSSVIPRTVLVAAGWPTDRLPKTGLQVALTGNVLPGGTPAADDPGIQWSTEKIVTGITESGLGKGKGNYAQLAALDAIKYPIGQACKHLGAEWYVPSKDELALIYINKSVFGASYAFSANYYRSATEGSGGNCWDVGFSNGYTIYGTKATTGRVRCVREL